MKPQGVMLLFLLSCLYLPTFAQTDLRVFTEQDSFKKGLKLMVEKTNQGLIPVP